MCHTIQWHMGRSAVFVDKGRGLIFFFFYLSGCCSEWMVFLLYWGPQFWVPMVIGPRMWFFLTASSISLWWLLYVLESLCKANCHSVSAVTSLILLIMCCTEEYAEPDNLMKLVEGHVHLHYRIKGTKTGTIWHVWGISVRVHMCFVMGL